MGAISRKTSFVVLILVSAATLLTACSTNSTPSQSSTDFSEGSSKQKVAQNSGMGEHGSMSVDLGSADADYDLRFIDAMTLHHQGAVAMAKQAQQKSSHPEIKKLAEGIVSAQEQEIAQMKQWRKAWYPNVNSTPMAYQAHSGHMMPMSSQQMNDMMMSKDLGKADNQFDLRFINGMIPHHQSAIVMAKDALNKSKRPQIEKLSQDIITSQQQEIDQMKQWQKAWYN